MTFYKQTISGEEMHFNKTVKYSIKMVMCALLANLTWLFSQEHIMTFCTKTCLVHICKKYHSIRKTNFILVAIGHICLAEHYLVIYWTNKYTTVNFGDFRQVL